MSGNIIQIKDHLDGTMTNIQGDKLFALIKKHFDQGRKVVLSFSEIQGMTSSFLNSSLGALVDEYGIDFLRKKMTLTNYRSSQMNMIKEYLSFYQPLH